MASVGDFSVDVLRLEVVVDVLLGVIDYRRVEI